MRVDLTAYILAAGLCLLVTDAAMADGTVEERQDAVKLYRGAKIIAASDPTSDVYVPNFTPGACEQLREQRWQEEALTRTTGSSTYKCQVEWRAIINFHPAPVPICPERPGDEQRQQACPTGTVGTWLQDRVWTLQPAPTCWVLGDWTPSVPPAGMCPLADSDGDGVPDQADECPTVHARTPNGCPATPPAQLAVPTNVRAQGISTSQIRVTWDPVSGASAYSLERCIGVTCTGFSQLLCVTGPAGTHSSLPANITARYRVRASRDAICSSDAGRDPRLPLNLGAYSAIVSGTTLGATPVNCAVSAWSTWSTGAWSTCSGGQQSRTETRTRTVTTQSANGGTACPALTETRTVTQACSSAPSGTASLRWTPPTRNTDGTALTNLAGYRISYGLTADALAHTVQIANPGASSYTVSNLAPGTWYFSVRAYTSTGAESANSNVGTKVIQ